MIGFYLGLCETQEPSSVVVEDVAALFVVEERRFHD
jgi:hypothetical protein